MPPGYVSDLHGDEAHRHRAADDRERAGKAGRSAVDEMGKAPERWISDPAGEKTNQSPAPPEWTNTGTAAESAG